MGPLRKKEYEAERLRAAMSLHARMTRRPNLYEWPIGPMKPPVWAMELYDQPIGPLLELPIRRRDPSANEIIELIGAAHGFSPVAIVSHSRNAQLVAARHLAMWCYRAMTGASLPAIGRRFGGRDNSTVLYALERMTQLHGLPSAYSIEAPDVARMILLHGIDRASEMWRARGDA